MKPVHVPSKAAVGACLVGVSILMLAACAGGSGGSGGGGGGGLTGSIGGDASTLIFSAEDSTAGVEPWVSEGTTQSTRRLADIGSPDSNPEGFTRVGDRIIFTAVGPNGREIWIADSDLGGARELMDINSSGDGVETGQSFPVLNGFAYFRGNDPNQGGKELWRTDGNQAGRVTNINPTGDSDPNGFAVFEGHVFFAATNGTDGIELWRTDGVTTEMVGPLNPGGDFAPENLTVAGGSLYFTAEDQTGDRELWAMADPQAAPAELAVNPDPSTGAGIRHLAAFDQGVVFAADDGSTGYELWVSRGTLNSTEQIADINNGAADGVPPDSVPVVIDGRLVFPADDSGSTYTPWTSPPTAGATPQEIAYNGPEPAPPTLSGEPGTFGALNGEMLFAGNTSSFGTELWRVNDTATEIFRVRDINDTAPAANSSPTSFATFDGNLYFSANDGTGRELWRYDGTSASKVLTGGPTAVTDITAIE